MPNSYINSKLKIFSLNSNYHLAKEIADEVGLNWVNRLLNASVTAKSKSTSRKVSVAVTSSSSNPRVRLLTKT